MAFVSRPQLRSILHRAFSTARGVNKGLRILFFGSDEFSVPFLHALHCNTALCSRLEVVSPPDSRRGRGNKLHPGALKFAAQSVGLEVHDVDASVDFRMSGFTLPYSETGSLAGHFDIGVVVAFGYFIPDWVIASFPLGMVNVHPSLLPWYRGAAPINRALLGREKRTGVSIQEVHPRAIDHGRILVQKELDVTPMHTHVGLKKELAQIGVAALDECLSDIEQLRMTAAIEFDASAQYPLAPKIEKTEGKLCFASSSASDLHWRWRALTGYTPLFTFFGGNRVNVLELELPFTQRCAEGKWADAAPGTAWLDKRTKLLFVRCADAEVIAISKLVPATKRTCSGADFLKKFAGNAEYIVFESQLQAS